MRVISGSARGVTLRAVMGTATRPTADRVKENLFNMLAPDLDGCRFLDLFSGTGAIGIEALSRGAALAVFVDNAQASAQVINDNLISARLTANARVLRADYKQALKSLAAEGALFDIIFMDPPYGMGIAADAVTHACAVLSAEGYMVAEISSKTPIEGLPADMCMYKTRKYGSATLVFIRPGREPKE